MARPYSEKYLLWLAKKQGEQSLGIELARVCTEANLTLPQVGKQLGVTKLTVFTWFRGGVIKPHRHEAIQTFIDQLRRDLRAKKLPVKSIAAGDLYLKNLK